MMIWVGFSFWQNNIAGGVAGGGGGAFSYSLNYSDSRNSFYFVLI